MFEWQAHADADWAGDRQSRKAVSGCGKHLTKAWTKQQSIVATGTAEAELYAGNREAGSRRAVRNNKLTVEKTPSETNSPSLGTKHLTSESSEMLMRLVNSYA